ncbi:MAG: histidine--tRNA ligase [Acidimicrobiia bacterium]
MPRVPDEVFRAPKGVHDVLPPASATWTNLVGRFADRAARFGYGLIVSPMFEHVEVFRRVGEHTDVVSKEMYEFEDKGGRTLALRPEGTASVVRAYVQHRPTAPWKVWYVAPNFRYERAQKGRYRQHWQLGAEVLGVDDPAVDVEVIALLDGFFRDLGLTGVTLALNSMGDAQSRPGYLAALRDYLMDHAGSLDPEFRERVEANPMRMLDTKVPEWQEVVERAPQLTEHLSEPARAHFELVQEGLQTLGISYELAPRLVRGFDYYTRTAFEFQSDALDAAQNALGGGGRYDGLAEEMGGPSTPGIGFGTGIERVVHALEAASVSSSARGLDAFVINGLGDAGSMRATLLVSELREEGLGADRSFGSRSVPAQWKAADRSGARFGVMLGRDEAERDAVAVKDLESGEQVEVPEKGLATWLNDRRSR